LYSRKKEIDNTEEDINKIIEDLSNSGYLKDQYLADAYVRRQLSKGYGPRIIRYKLGVLKLSPENINLALESEAGKDLQLQAARNFAARNSRKDHRKIASSLYQRGFDSQVIQKVFDDMTFED